MAKKHFKGYKGKTSAKIIATSATLGVITLAIVGGTVAHKLSNRPKQENPYETTETTGNNINNPVLEPSITPEQPGYEDYTPETTLPELQEPIIPDDTQDIVEDLGVEFVEVLAKLTEEAKDYIQGITGSATAPNITIVGLTNMQINHSNGDVVLLGQINVNGTLSNFISTMGNNNTSLNIYNLSTEAINEDKFVSALDELLSDEGTSFKLTLKQHLKLSNADEVVDNILNNRIAELNATGSTEQSVVDEIAHITSMLESCNLKLNVLLNNRTTGDNGYIYSFNISVNTGKYVYSANLSFESKRVLTTTAIKQNIEEYLTTNTNFAIDVTTSSAINQALYLINGEIFNVKDENTLNQ